MKKHALKVLLMMLLGLILVGCKTQPKIEDPTYTVTFKDYDGNIIKEEVVKHGEAATAPEIDSDALGEYYVFSGWSVSFDHSLKI